jgi:epoxyqueuosine reductase
VFTPTITTTRERVRSLLLAQGFARVGFARAGPAAAADRFREWVERGFGGEMRYLWKNSARRLDPRQVLPGARTVIVAALRYREGGAYGVASPSTERAEISAYARGTDYHDVLEARLKTACETLREELPASYRYYVDTGPVLEKAWAAEAGIGWIGKNTCSLSTELGSFYFLGVVLTSLEIEPDPPALDHCGSCTLCIESCPTAALVEPYVLDARRCISYLTIELRGEIPEALEPATGNLVFGCDICQEVCPWNGPWNEGDDPPVDADVAPRPENVFPRLEDLANLDAGTFRQRFQRSAVRRAKFAGFFRNVIVALGNSQSPRAAAILDALKHRDDVRSDPMLSGTIERACERAGTASKKEAP